MTPLRPPALQAYHHQHQHQHQRRQANMNQNISSPHTRQNALHTHMKPRQVDFRKYLHERDQDREHHDHVATVVVVRERERAQKKSHRKSHLHRDPVKQPPQKKKRRSKAKAALVVVSPHHHVVSSLPKSYKLAARIGFGSVRFRNPDSISYCYVGSIVVVVGDDVHVNGHGGGGSPSSVSIASSVAGEERRDGPPK